MIVRAGTIRRTSAPQQKNVRALTQQTSISAPPTVDA
jgi:hypothetical protein